MRGFTNTPDTTDSIGANAALSNLASVAINTSLISDADSTDNLGSTSKQWANLYVDNIKCATATDLTIENDGEDKDIIFKVNDGSVDTEMMRIDGSTSNIGIGTITPTSKIEISSIDDRENLLLHNLGTGDGNYTGISFKVSSNTGNEYKKGAILFERTDISGRGKLHFALENGNDPSNVDLADSKMVINCLGNVGIGTTTPEAKLAVEQTGADVAMLIRSNDQINYDARIKFASLENWELEQMKFDENGNTGYDIGFNYNRSEYSGDFYISNNGTKKFIVKSSGNVGINETEPQDTLEVNGTIMVKNKLKFTQDDGNEYIDSLADNYLDIGATTAVRIKPVLLAEDAVYFTQTDGAEKIDSAADGYLDLYAGTSVRLNSDLEIGEYDIKLDAVLSGDEKWSGITIPGTAGATLAVGDICYLKTSDSQWYLVDGILDGTDTGCFLQLGICILAANDNAATEMLVYGKIRSASFPAAFTVGAAAYLSDTAGNIVVARPSTTNFVVRNIGYAISATDLLFNPSPDYAVVA